MRLFQVVSIAALLVLLRLSAAHAQSPRDTVETPTHRFQKIAKGVYFAVGTGSIHVMSNSMVVIGDTDVLVVDSHVTPAAARALLKSIEALTDKPVRYLVNTHYHFDHAHGNQAFPDGVEIIGHEYTREKLLGNVLEENTYRSFTGSIPVTIQDLRDRVAQQTGPERKAALQARLKVQEDYLEATGKVVPTPPNLTLRTEMSIYMGDREIRLLHLGLGHTGGDVVVFLPAERIVFTGDLMLPFLSYMGDGFVDEWPATLEALKQLDFDVILPGHGAPLRDKAFIGHIQGYLEDLWKRAGEAKANGLSAEEASKQIDLTDHKRNIPQISGPGVDPRAVRRIYQLLEARTER